MRTLGLAVAAACVALFAASCDNQGPMEEAGERADEAVEDTGQAVEDAGEDIEDAADRPNR